MVIKISDDLPAERRRMLLEVFPIIYALKHNNNDLKSAAKWLGVAKKTMLATIREHQELRGLICNQLPTEEEIIIEEDIVTRTHPLQRVYDNQLRKMKTSFFWSRLNDRERKAHIARLMRLYLDVY